MITYTKKDDNTLIETASLPDKVQEFSFRQIETCIAEKEADIARIQVELDSFKKRKTEAEKLEITDIITEEIINEEIINEKI